MLLPMSIVVETDDLRREFSPKGRRATETVVALDDVDLTVTQGEIHGLLGPNGAGKTTLVKVLSTILIPTRGTARVFGYDVVKQAAQVRPLIGLVFGGDRGLYTRLTARHNLEYWAALYSVPASRTPAVVSDLLDRVGLTERADDRVESFSRGMKQRLHLARGLVADPVLMFLDEPTVGLDPLASLEFRRLVLELREAGKTIFMTTHDLAEAEAVCDRVSLIDHGKILATERPATLGKWVNRYEWVEAQGVAEPLVVELGRLNGVETIERREDGWVRFQPEAEGTAAVLLERLVAAGITSIRTGFPTLEDVYVRIIGDRGMQV